MRFSVTVVDGRDHRRIDTLLDADPDQPLAEVLPAVLEVAGEHVHPSFASRVPVWVDGRPADAGRSLREGGLRPGSTLALHAPVSRDGDPRGVAEIRVVGGPGAGRVHRIGLGETLVGCGAAGLSLPDVLLPPDALRVVARPGGEVEVQVVTGLEVRLDGEPVTGSVTWAVGGYLDAGDTVLELADPGVEPAQAEPAADHPGIDVNRPPRLLPPDRERGFTLPVPPGRRPKQAIPWIMVLAPMVMAAPTALFYPRALIFAFMSPIMALGNVVQMRRGSRKQFTEDSKRYAEELADVEARIETALVRERDARRSLGPDPATVLLTAMGPGRRLWERRRADPDSLVLRLGLADLPAGLSVSEPGLAKSTEPPEPRGLLDVPAGLALRELGVVGLAGAAEPRDALARWLVAQSAVLHSPRDLRIVLVTDAQAEDRWGWVRWLPHARVDDERVPATVGTEQMSVGRRLAELTQLVTERTAAAVDAAGGPRRGLPPGPDLLVVLDGARRLRALPGVVQLLRDGPAAGVHLLCLDDQVRELPEECRGVVDCPEHGRISLHRTMAADVTGILPDLVEVAWADRVARALAPLRDTTPDVEDAGIPTSARLLEVSHLDPPTADGILQRWRTGPNTDVVLGAGYDGAFHLDLRGDGPHALVAGTTGSGKSELLQTLVAALAIANRPDQLTFVLVDYKGGSAFKDCARLPHTVGMVTDLDNHLVSRALTSLGAELRRREHMLTVPGAKDLEDYWALQVADPVAPRDAAAGAGDRRVRLAGGGAAGLRQGAGEHRAAGPLAGHPPGARDPAADRRRDGRHPGEHEPADLAARHRRGREPRRHRRPGRRADRTLDARSGLRADGALDAAAVPGRAGRWSPAGRSGRAGRGRNAAGLGHPVVAGGPARPDPAAGGGGHDGRGRHRPVGAGGGDRGGRAGRRSSRAAEPVAARPGPARDPRLSRRDVANPPLLQRIPASSRPLGRWRTTRTTRPSGRGPSRPGSTVTSTSSGAHGRGGRRCCGPSSRRWPSRWRPGTCTSTHWTAATAPSCRWTRSRTAAPSSSAPRPSGPDG